MSSPENPIPYTSRGRALDAPVPSKPTKRDNPLGPPLMQTEQPTKLRQRSNSLRRLPDEHLLALAHKHESEHVRAGAARELDVRNDLVVESQGQFPHSAPPFMAAKREVTRREVNAMRFAASMAEEAQDQINREGKPDQIGQIAVANVNGHLGLGFSGKQSEMSHTRKVEQRMLDLQRHYDQAGQSAHWSTRLEPVQVTDIFAQSDANICAAKRASHVAHSMALGPGYLGSGPADRQNIPPPDSMIEMMNPSTSGRGNLLSDFSAPRRRTGSVSASSSPHQTISGRPRSASVDAMADSCKTCMAEHEAHMSKRADHGGHL